MLQRIALQRIVEVIKWEWHCLRHNRVVITVLIHENVISVSSVVYVLSARVIVAYLWPLISIKLFMLTTVRDVNKQTWPSSKLPLPPFYRKRFLPLLEVEDSIPKDDTEIRHLEEPKNAPLLTCCNLVAFRFNLLVSANLLVEKTEFCSSQVIGWEDHLWNVSSRTFNCGITNA